MTRLMEMIHDDLQANLSLKTLANAARLSHHHFSRVFKCVKGFSPHQSVLSQCVQLARRLMVETTLLITAELVTIRSRPAAARNLFQ
jgi:transcriptional regulator GlxA family with amidase domain